MTSHRGSLQTGFLGYIVKTSASVNAALTDMGRSKSTIGERDKMRHPTKAKRDPNLVRSKSSTGTICFKEIGHEQQQFSCVINISMMHG
jgi:hypothetical protein